jgi:glutamine synthetase
MHDPSRPYALSKTAEPFVAGILHHLPAIAALTAPSIASYFRLRRNRWAPVWANLAERDRGASLRVCAVVDSAIEDAASQFNVEYRVSDATASPYMALGAIVHAGVDGIRQGMRLPSSPAVTVWEMSDEQRSASGIAALPPVWTKRSACSQTVRLRAGGSGRNSSMPMSVSRGQRSLQWKG